MIKLLRSLFGLNGVTGNRSVVGSPDSIDANDLPYITDSKRRLAALQELHSRYKSSPHAQKLLAVYEKTRRIHRYLVNRKKGHELELFHLQHTDHFLNTFTAIINAHQQHYEEEEVKAAPPKPIRKADMVGKTLVIGPFRRDSREVKAANKLNRATSQQAFADITEANIDVPRLTLPQISINTYAKIVYLKEDVAGGLSTNEIGFTSTPEEKANFISYIAVRLGIADIAYIGNAMVYVPNHNSSHPAEVVPVVHWNGAPYALSLEDDLLFPVRTYRKNH